MGETAEKPETLTSSSEAGRHVDPKPGFVLKTRRGDGTKVFVNICHHESAPQTSAFKGSNRYVHRLAALTVSCVFNPKTAVDL